MSGRGEGTMGVERRRVVTYRKISKDIVEIGRLTIEERVSEREESGRGRNVYAKETRKI